MTDDPQPHKQTRDTFITLYNTRLFTAEQVWDMCHRSQCVERERVLNLLKKEMGEYSSYWLQQSGYETLVYLEEQLRQGGE